MRPRMKQIPAKKKFPAIGVNSGTVSCFPLIATNARLAIHRSAAEEKNPPATITTTPRMYRIVLSIFQTKNITRLLSIKDQGSTRNVLEVYGTILYLAVIVNFKNLLFPIWTMTPFAKASGVKPSSTFVFAF